MKKWPHLIWLLSVALLLVRCSDSNVSQSVKPIPILPELDYATATKQHEVFKKFVASQAYDAIQQSLGTFEIEDITLASDRNSASQGLVIRINPANGMQRDIMVVVTPTLTGENIVALVRAQNVTSKISSTGTTTYRGYIKWNDATGAPVNEITIEDSKISKFLAFEAVRNARVAAPCCWACTDAQFNANYHYLKGECEKDWECDAACSFNICAVAFLIESARMCTECGQYNPS